MYKHTEDLDICILEDMEAIHEICHANLHIYEGFFYDFDFLPEYLDTYVGDYIRMGGNKEGIYNNDINLYEYIDCMHA